LDGDERERIRQAAAAYEYKKRTTEECAYSLRHVDWLTDEALKRLQKIDAIVSAYRYDCSNSMVDYFDTNFYYDIVQKPVASC
jgi:predicted amidohydrolase YtcJ